MWVKNAWYVAGWSHEFAPGRVHARTIIDQPIALYRIGEGGLVALEDRCCHRFAPLSMGRIEGDDLRCMYHGLKFAPDGRCIEIPGQKLIPQSACVRRYPLVVRGSWVWLWMGNAALADPAAIAPSLALDDSRYRPQEAPFTRETLPKVFGDLYEVLAGLPVGEPIDLSSLAALRHEYPPMTEGAAAAFRYIQIRRGATFPGIPASSTARKFSSMSEEVPPWMVTLVPA